MAERTQIQVEIILTKISCCSCGGVFAINEVVRKNRKERGGDFHCPYCDTSLGYHDTDLMKLQRQLMQSEQERQAAIEEARHFRLSRDRLLSRANKGVCPHCKRYFANVHKHIECKHKDKLR